jgi:hypothetical protein
VGGWVDAVTGAAVSVVGEGSGADVAAPVSPDPVGRPVADGEPVDAGASAPSEPLQLTTTNAAHANPPISTVRRPRMAERLLMAC